MDIKVLTTKTRVPDKSHETFMMTPSEVSEMKCHESISSGSEKHAASILGSERTSHAKIKMKQELNRLSSDYMVSHPLAAKNSDT
jgi:hypothetical protein